MATIWQAVVVIDGVDRSASLRGQVTVTAEEGAARTAAFSIVTPAGTVTPGDWLGVSVTVDYRLLDGNGATLSQERIFTGIIDEARYEPADRVTHFRCTDGLQETMATKSAAEIDALLTGTRWSDAVFGEFEDGWRYLQDRMSTVPASYDLNRDGATGVQAVWAAKTTPDFSYDASAIIGGSLRYSLTPRRDLVNEVAVSYDYRFTRQKHREHAFSWSIYDWGTSGWFCGIYFQDSHELPTREMVRAAAGGSGWATQTPITFTKLPASASDPCGIGVSWSISDELRETLITSASWIGARRWTQQATEHYILTVRAPQSVTWLGTVQTTDSTARETDYSDAGWTEGVDTPTGTDVRTDAHGDYVIDKLDRAAADNDIETLIAKARVTILAAHRANWIEARVELEPTLERWHTVRIDGASPDGAVLRGKGKVALLEHELDIDAGSALTRVRIALSQNGGQAAITDDAITAPATPGTDPTVGPPTTSTTFQTHIGGKSTAPPYDDTWDGFTGNYTLQDPGAETYPRQFVAVGPEVNQEAVDPITGSVSAVYSFNVPHDELTITVA